MGNKISISGLLHVDLEYVLSTVGADCGLLGFD
jgi:hypothetical protein